MNWINVVTIHINSKISALFLLTGSLSHPNLHLTRWRYSHTIIHTSIQIPKPYRYLKSITTHSTHPHSTNMQLSNRKSRTVCDILAVGVCCSMRLLNCYFCSCVQWPAGGKMSVEKCMKFVQPFAKFVLWKK